MVTIPVTQPFCGSVSVGCLGGFTVFVMVGSGAVVAPVGSGDGAETDGDGAGAETDGAGAETDGGGAEADELGVAPHPAASAPAATAMPILL
ncbi:hypothetical protein GCM10023107_36820 [Actinoplanes octamycinicus]|nr:hypothetical protein Aoc01nite_30020 [Actinoplanes octamycinicus]